MKGGGGGGGGERDFILSRILPISQPLLPGNYCTVPNWKMYEVCNLILTEDIWRNLNVNIRYVAIPIMSNIMDTQLTNQTFCEK